MNKDLKNIGVSFAIAVMVDDLSLTKLSLPLLKNSNGIYILNSKDGKISRTINLNNDNLQADGDNLLKDVLCYAYEQLTGENSKFVLGDYVLNPNYTTNQSQNSAIAMISNALKQQAIAYLNDKQKNADSDIISDGEQHLMQLEDRIFTIEDGFYNNTDENSKDFEAFEYGLAFLDETYGMTPVDPNALFTQCKTSSLNYQFKTSGDFIEQLKLYNSQNIDAKRNIDEEYIDNEEYFDDEEYDNDEEFFDDEGYNFDDDYSQENDIEESPRLEDLDENDISTLDYMIYRQAKEDYNNAKRKKPSKNQNPPQEKEELDSELQKYIEDKYLEEMAKLMDLENSDFLKKLCDTAEKLFKDDKDLPNDKLNKLGAIFAEDPEDEDEDKDERGRK